MENTRWNYYFLCILALALLFTHTTHAYAAATSELKTINVVMDDNYPPYSFRDSQGNLQGITLDQWKLFEQKTGTKVNIIGLPWNEAYESMTDGEFDVLDSIYYSAERTEIFDYVQPYATIDISIFFHKNISGITDVNSLKGFTVGAMKGDNSIKVLKEHGITFIDRKIPFLWE